MKKTSLLLAGLYLSGSMLCATPSDKIQQSPWIIPAPNQLIAEKDTPGFSLKEKQKLTYSIEGSIPSFDEKELQNLFKDLNITLSKAKKGKKADIKIQIVSGPTVAKEGHNITVTPDQILVEAGDAAGLFYALQSLKQSVVKDINGTNAIPKLSIKDSPRFTWRGLMIDSGRNPLSVADLKKIIDSLAQYKINTIQWHLTEDQGWRIEIKKYPKLTSVGGTREGSAIMGNRNKRNDVPHSFFYTQKEIKEIVKYAKDRHITVVPEIEVPGHAAAAITAYPEFGNTDVPNYKPYVHWQWGVHPYIFSPKEETFKFLDDVFTEVAALFPDSPYIHIGGDEAPKTQWDQSPFAKEIMTKNNLKNSHELQSYFISRVEELVNKHGKKIVGWDEIQEGGLSKTATMMVWRDWKWATHALQNGNEIIMTPTSHCYFDYGQGEKPAGPEYDMIGGNVPLEKVYDLNPIPEGTTPEQMKRILGVQANCWSEYIPTRGKWEYMVYPRVLALAEVAWTQPEKKNIENFQTNLKQHKESILKDREINFRKEDGSPAQPDAPLLRPDQVIKES